MVTRTRGTVGNGDDFLEICRDVGTGVVAPGGGWFADQWSEVVTYGCDDDGAADPVSLSAAVSAALTRPMPRPADRVWRAEQRAAVRGHAVSVVRGPPCPPPWKDPVLLIPRELGTSLWTEPQ